MLAVSIKLNDPVVVSVAPTPFATPFGCAYVIVPPVAVSKLEIVAAITGEWYEIAVDTKLSTYCLLAASAFCCGCGILLMYSLLALILPVVLSVKSPVDINVKPVPTTVLEITLPPVMLPVALINPPVNTFPPVTLPLMFPIPVTVNPVESIVTLVVPPVG